MIPFDKLRAFGIYVPIKEVRALYAPLIKPENVLVPPKLGGRR